MTRRYRRSTSSIATVLVVVVVLVIAAFVHSVNGRAGAVDPAPSAGSSGAAAVETPASGGPPTPVSTDASTYLAELSTIAVGTVDPAGYSRDRFGDGWKDPDHNGCDSRNDVLARDLTATTFKPGTHDCIVLTGTLADPYTGRTIDFVRGNATSEAVQIDHIVPLSWSWSHGAASWTDGERLQFANDPRNLRAVDGPTNGSKSDSGPAEWMPPRASFACTYVETFLAVLVDYRLSVDAADSEAIRRTLADC